MTKHEYICHLTEVAALKSTCLRRQVGAIFVNKDLEVLTTGYNGAPRGMPHCTPETCHDGIRHCLNTVHAEQNAIVQAAKHGTSLYYSILYATSSPCETCAMLLINLGIKKIVFKDIYSTIALNLLTKAKIKLERWEC